MRAIFILTLSGAIGVLGFTNGCSSSSSSTTPDAGSTSDAGPGACTPKTGFDVAVPSSAPGPASVGHVAMVLAADGSPRIAYVGYDPHHDGNDAESALFFVAYDGATCAWRPPVKVDTTGDVDTTRDREVTIARDPSSGQLGIGYQTYATLDDSSTQVMLAQSSDDGATWTTEQIARNSANTFATDDTVSRPTIAMKNGKTFFAYRETWLLAGSASNGSDADGFHLLSRNGASGAFADVIVPPVSGATLPGAESTPPALAIDDAGNAGFVYVARTDDATANLRVCYFASNKPSAVAVLDSENTQNDSADLALAFDGDKPRIAAGLQRGASDTTAVWFSASDDGVTWGAPVQIPNDGGDGMGTDLALALDGTGNPSIAVRKASASGSTTCGSPKLATGTGLTAFTTCGPPLGDPTYGDGFYGDDVQLGFAPTGKRIMAMAASSSDPTAGVIVWREP